MTEDINALLIAYDYVCREIGEAEQNDDGNEWSEGHINGLKEARNRVKEAILEKADE